METNTPWNQLIELLEMEIQLYRALKDLMGAESTALIEPDLDAFNRLLGDKQVLVEKLQHAEAARTAWLRSHGFQAPHAGKPRLKTLVARAPRDASRHLERCRRELVALTGELEARNHLHRKMLNHSSGLAENALRLLGNQLFVQPTYQANGDLSGTGKGGFVLSGLA
jgi:flagellar biosynthesis/type III secretory pathway chaperone